MSIRASRAAILATLTIASAVLGCSAILGLKDVTIEDPDASPPVDGSPPKDTSVKDAAAPLDAADAADACTAKTDSDPVNCGFCGHDCLGGGCTKGICQPIQIGTTDYSSGALAIDATYLYVGGEESVTRMGKDGSSPTGVASQDAYYLFVSGVGVGSSDLYLSVGGYYDYPDGSPVFHSGRFLTCPVGGCGANHASATSVYPTSGSPDQLVVDPLGIFFSDFYNSSLLRCDYPNCASPAPQTFTGEITAFASDGAKVFFTDFNTNAVRSCALSGCGGGPSLVTSGVSMPRGLATDATNVYVASSTGAGQVLSVPKGGGSQTALANNINQPWTIAVDPTYVFWTSLGTLVSYHSTTGKVSRCPIAGCGANNVNEVDLATGLDVVYRMVSDATALYYIEGDGTTSGKGLVWRVAK